MRHIITTLFGSGTWGAGGNIVAWVLCGIPSVMLALWHHRRKMRAEFARLHARIDTAQPQREAQERVHRPQ